MLTIEVINAKIGQRLLETLLNARMVCGPHLARYLSQNGKHKSVTCTPEQDRTYK